MIITCPNCETRFNINPAALLPNGRTVKCARCAHTWTERPPADAPPRRAAAPARADKVSEPPKPDDDLDDIPDPDAPPPLDGPRRRRAPRQAVPIPVEDGRRSYGGQVIAILVLVVVLGAVLAAAAFLRETVVGIAPGTAAIYERIGLGVARVGDGLEIRNIVSQQKVQNDKPVIAISGEIVNTTSAPIGLPGLRGALLDVREREVYVWTFAAGKTTIAPGQVVAFDTAVEEPPSAARRIAIAFFEDKKK